MPPVPTSFSGSTSTPADPSQGKRQSTTLAPDGAGVDAVPGADLSLRNLSMAYLIGADLTNAVAYATNLSNADLSQATLSNAYFAVDLTSASLREAHLANASFAICVGNAICSQHTATLTDADFTDAELSNANFYGATLTGADFTDAEVRGASFRKHAIDFLPNFPFLIGTGITPPQLYTTASYQAHDLSWIDFAYNDLAGGNFAGQNLANAFFYRATLTNVDFTGADTRGTRYLNLSAAVTTNLIRPDGHINGLDLDSGRLLVVRDYDGNPYNYDDYGYPNPIPPIPITIDQHLTMGPGGTLRMVFEADAWDSTISFAPGIPVTLGGTLELTFAADVNLASQIGRTFDLFNWTGVTPTGAFAISSPYAWDLSNLYTTGEVTLTAVPEPDRFALADRRALSG